MYDIKNDGLELIHTCHDYFDRTNQNKPVWNKELQYILNQRFNLSISANAWKKRYYRAKNMHKLDYESVGKQLTQSTTYNSNTKETQVEATILVHKNDLITPQNALERFNYDTRLWKLTKFKHSESSGTSTKSPTGEWNAEHFSLTLAQKEFVEFTKDDVEEVYQSFKYKHKPIQPIKPQDKNTKIFFIPDLHIGLRDDEIGWNLEKATETYSKVLGQMKEDILRDKPQKVLIVFLGDFIHYDNANRTTTKGTLQLESENPYRMLDTAIELAHMTVKELAIAEKNKVIFLKGNHDKVLSYAMFKPLPLAFSQYDNIEFEINKKERTAMLINNTAIFLQHGDIPKARKLDWCAFEYSGIYAVAQERLMFMGHLHNFKLEIDSDKGIIAVILPSLTTQSEYEYTQGYANYQLAVSTTITETGYNGFKLYKV